jgi:general secretion pathway protein A
MYATFFGLKREPFSIAPDPHFLFMSERHREALAHLLYGLDGGGGFVLLTGEVGAGKTTVCRCFLEQIPKRCNVAYIFNPKLTVVELLRSICEEFHIPGAREAEAGATVKHYLDPLNEFLLRTHAVGQNNVLIIDEAQNLSPEVLEQLRLLTNLETSERKLLQIILIGQPELRDMLARPDLEQLATRVIARFHLEALSEAETSQYIKHRLAVAGMKGTSPFDRESRQLIHRLSRGIPRRINLLCDRALLGAYSSDRPKVDRPMVEKAAREVFYKSDRHAGAASQWRRTMIWAGAGLAGAALLGIAALPLVGGSQQASPAAAASAAGGATPATAASAPRATSTGRAASAAAVTAATPRPAIATPGLETAEDLTVRFDTLLRSLDEAWRELAREWNLSLANGDPCRLAMRSGVHCFKGDSGMALIRKLGRPAILTLYDEAGRPAYALLVGLTEQSAFLRAGGVAQTVSLVALARTWRGDFATFWRAPPGYRDRIVDGQTGEAIDWLAAQLAKVQGQPLQTRKNRFDAALKARVYAFQFGQELRPDGLPGPETIMQLNRAASVDEPRLQTEE